MALDYDAELMLRVKDGDGSSFAVLLDKHRAPVIHFLYRMVQDGPVSEELAQEVFLRVYRSRETYEPTAKFTTWLFRIATHLALNWLRDEKNERDQERLDETVADAPVREVPDQAPSVEHRMVRQVKVDEVRRAVAAAEARAARRTNKANETALEKWNRMSPAERQRALAKMPPERRRQLQQKLQQYRNLPPQEKQQRQDRYQAFTQLPPDQQKHARAVFRQFNSLSEDRRPMVRKEFEELRSMTPADQAARMNTEAFRSRYTPAELQMLQDLARLFGSPR